ncbi:MAG: bile acid:sodium symporter family protein [Rhodospirillaceae bacterium]|jgi:bile acid:Na+ symporter, BASS family|nr:bile acid:sodium symporter family protein [Rhodospirillaceae bacterium]
MGQVAEVFLPLALAFIMFSLGLGLTGADFKRVVVQPRDFLVGALGQIVLLPLVAFVLVSVWPLAPELAVGVMVIAAAPGGVTSNLLTRFAGGDTALSVSLTAVISLVSILTVPAIVFFALDRFGGVETGDLSIAATALKMFAIVAVPVAIGTALRALAPRFATGFERIGRIVSGILFVIVLFGAIYENRDNVLDYFAQAGLVTLTLNLVMMALAFFGAALARVGRPQRIALSLECGLQNGTLAIAVVATLGLAGTYAIPAAIYSLIMFATAIVFAVFVARRAA